MDAQNVRGDLEKVFGLQWAVWKWTNKGVTELGRTLRGGFGKKILFSNYIFQPAKINLRRIGLAAAHFLAHRLTAVFVAAAAAVSSFGPS